MELHEDQLDKVIQEALAENSITPLVKMELACKVRQRRQMKGEDDIEVSFEPPKMYELTEEEKHKIEQRKQRNRLSAERARIKRKCREEDLHNECQSLEEQQRSLQCEMKQLTTQLTKYKKILYTHLLLVRTSGHACPRQMRTLHHGTLMNT